MRDEPKIDRAAIADCLRREYGRYPTDIEYLPVGLDHNAAVYRVPTDGQTLLAKVKRGTFYEAACLVPRWLANQGIESVVAPLATSDGALWSEADGWKLIVYPYIEGTTERTGMTPGQWASVGRSFRRIQDSGVPPTIGDLRIEVFAPSRYRGRVEELAALLETDPSGAAQELRPLWRRHGEGVLQLCERMEAMSEGLRSTNVPLVICHADLHPANILRDHPDHSYIIDWDDVMLAARERDFIFVRDEDDPEGSPFFEGYGPYEVDWQALAYYRYERVVTDAIAWIEEAVVLDVSDAERQLSIDRFAHNLDSDMLLLARATEDRIR
jgi:spectinomycin phosphotransferase